MDKQFASQWRQENADVKSVRAALWDVNGIQRGKRLPISGLKKALEGGLRMPLSIAGMDVWGADIADNPLVFEAGDVDGISAPTERGPVPIRWTGTPTALLPVWLFEEPGVPYLGDPRQVLNHVLDRFRALGWRPVVSTELEFYLVTRTGHRVRPASSRSEDVSDTSPATMDIAQLDAFEPFIEDVFKYGREQNLPLDTAIAETGACQFEINLNHCDDVLRAADDALLLKALVRGVAKKHGLDATFMAKPFADMAGNGLHVHFSLLDADGRNLFDDGTDAGTPMLLSAIAGLQRSMVDSTLIFAPHFNSYRRITPGSHAPVKADWGYENRMTALRIPAGPNAARRVEHRVSGADANPYLVLATILGTAMDGILDKARPTDPTDPDTPEVQVPALPPEWRTAIDLFAGSDRLAALLPEVFRTMFLSCKQQELAAFTSRVTPFEYESYLTSV